jgi:hypothetical protein
MVFSTFEVNDVSYLRSREINVALIFVSALLMITTYFFNIPLLSSFATIVQTTVSLFAAFTLGLGALNLLVITYRQVKSRAATAPFAIWSIVIMVTMIVAGLIPPLMNSPQFQWLYNNIEAPTDSTMYAMMVFFVASACFRAFRARSKEAFVMLVAGFFVIFMNAPIGVMIWKGLPVIGRWIEKYPMTGASRGFGIGVALGGIGISLRILLGYERKLTGE